MRAGRRNTRVYHRARISRDPLAIALRPYSIIGRPIQSLLSERTASRVAFRLEARQGLLIRTHRS